MLLNKSPQLEFESFKFIRSHLVRAGGGIILLAFALTAFAAELDVVTNSPDWLQLGLGLFGGLALFLSGLQLLSDGMKKAAGRPKDDEDLKFLRRLKQKKR